MSTTHRIHNSCKTKHALAIAKWEKNQKKWIEGNIFRFISKSDEIQRMVGDGGTLWIVISRKNPSGSRSYSLSFEIKNCQKLTLIKSTRFGRYAVIGDPNQSTLYANNDARYLLLSLRFDPYLPIDHPHYRKKKNKKEILNRMTKIGQSIQKPRCLSKADVKLLRNFGAEADRWSVFISYEHTNTDKNFARKIYQALEQQGFNIFKDQEALRGGDLWWPTIERAIGKSKFLILILGKTTSKSVEVEKEVLHAKKKKVMIIPVLAGGKLNDLKRYNISELHYLSYEKDDFKKLIGEISSAINKKRN